MRKRRGREREAETERQAETEREGEKKNCGLICHVKCRRGDRDENGGANPAVNSRNEAIFTVQYVLIN